MKWKRQIPNMMTASRILAVPVLIWILNCDLPNAGLWAAGVFILASFTDYLDGALARKMGIESIFGKFFDPVADKILVSSTLVLLIPFGRLEPLMVIILLGRDTLIGGIRSAAASENMIIGAGVAGKWKTAIQMIAIPGILVKENLFGIPVYTIGYWTLWLSVVLSVVSGAEYAIRYFRDSKNFNES